MEKLLKVIRDGKLKIGEKKLACAVLEDGTRILSRNAIFRAFGRTKRGRSTGEIRVLNMPSFIDAKNLQPFIDKDLHGGLKGIKYLSKTGKKIYSGYKAEILPMLCGVYLEARRKDELKTQQLPLAIVAEILTQSFSKIGIIALIDEATGYDEIRDKEALQEILSRYISEDLMKWQKRFPDEFYKHLFRLRGWEWRGRQFNPPQIVGKITKDIIYDRLAPGVREELEKLNPPNEKGRRKVKHHQWLTPDVGHPRLQEHIGGVLALERIAPNWRKFYSSIQRAFPKPGEQTEMNL